jgi:hypothetical protein
MHCSQCGAENYKDAKVCQHCGATLPARDIMDTTITFRPLDEPDKEAPVKVEDISEEAVFVVKRGSTVGQRFPLKTGEITLGRDPQSDIFLGDITVSRKHAKVTVGPSTVEVSDVGSLNGTYVNGTRIERQLLKHGDELQVGKFKLIFLEGKSQRSRKQ